MRPAPTGLHGWLRTASRRRAIGAGAILLAIAVFAVLGGAGQEAAAQTTDSETPLVLAVTLETPRVPDDYANSAKVTVSYPRDSGHTDEVRVLAATGRGTDTATRGTDYQGLPSDETILLEGIPLSGVILDLGPPNELNDAVWEHTIEIPIIADSDSSEGEETFTIRLVSGTRVFPDADGKLNDVVDLTVTIVDLDRKDSDVLIVSPVGYAEEGNDLVFEVEVDGNGYGTVDYEAEAGSAAAADFTATSGTFTLDGEFSPTARIRVPTVDDSFVEGAETVILKLTNPTGDLKVSGVDADGNAVAEVTAEGIITDNEPPVKAYITDVTVTEGGEAKVKIEMERLLKNNESVAFEFGTWARDIAPCREGGNDITASQDVDYEIYPRVREGMGPGQRAKEFKLRTFDDQIDEPDECLWLRVKVIHGLDFKNHPNTLPHQVSALDIFGVVRSKVTIRDNDEPPTMYFNAPAVSERDDDQPVSLDFHARLDKPSGKTISVDYAPGTPGRTEVPARAGLDFTDFGTGMLTIPPGAVAATLSVEVLGDYDEEPDEVVPVRFSDPVNACFPGGGSCPSSDVEVTGMIYNDDEELRVSIMKDQPFVREGETAFFTLSMSRPIPYDVTFSANAVGGSGTGAATAGADFQQTALTFHVPRGQTSARASVSTISDTVDEPTETFNIAVSGAPSFTGATAAELKELFGSGYSEGDPFPLSMNSGVGIVDGPALSVTPLRSKVTEGGVFEFEAKVHPVSTQDVTFSWKTEDGGVSTSDARTAKAGSDYQAVSTQTVTIPAGESTAPLLLVTTLQDTIDEDEQQFRVMVTPTVTGATLLNAVTIATIRDDDPRPRMSIGDASAVEGADLEFPVTLSEASEKDFTVYWVTEDATASTANQDYQGTLVRMPLNFVSGETRKVIRVATVPDDVPEDDERFRVQLVHAGGATFADPTGVGTITNDDGIGFFIHGVRRVNEPTNRRATPPQAGYIISMYPAQTSPVTINWETRDVSARTGGALADGEQDYTPVPPTPVTFQPGEIQKQVSTTVLWDGYNEADEDFEAVISGIDSDFVFLERSVRTTIVDTQTFRIWVDSVTVEVPGQDPYQLDLDSPGPLVIPEATGDAPTIAKVKVRRTDSSAYDNSFPANANKTHAEIIVCFVTEPSFGLFQGISVDAGVHPSPDNPPWADVDVYFQEKGRIGFVPAQCHTANDAAAPYWKNLDEGVYETTYPLAIVADSRPETNETFIVWNRAQPYGVGEWRFDDESERGPAKTFTILDDDKPYAYISDAKFREKDGKATITVKLHKPPTTDETVTIAIEDGTTTAFQDYLPGSQPLHSRIVSISRGSDSSSIDIPLVQDGLVEGDEHFTVTLVDSSDDINIDPRRSVATITIENSDHSASELLIPDVVVDEGKKAQVEFQVVSPLPDQTNEHIRVLWTEATPQSGAAATPMDDYQPLTAQDQENGRDYKRSDIRGHFPRITVRIPTTDDSVYEGDEDFGIAVASRPTDFRNPTLPLEYHGYMVDSTTGRLPLVAIRDNDQPDLSIAPIDDSHTVQGKPFTLPAVPVATGGIGAVTWSVEGLDGAVFSVDPDTGVLSLPALEYDDPQDHNQDNVYVATLRATDEDGNTATQTARVDVNKLELIFSKNPVTVGEPSAASNYAVRIEHPPGGTMTVHLTLDGDTDALKLDKTSLTFNDDNYMLEQTVKVTPVNDDLDNPDDRRDATIIHTASGSGFTRAAQFPLPVLITDDDTRGIKVSEVALTVVQVSDPNFPGSVQTYEVSLNSQPDGGDVTVTLGQTPSGSLRVEKEGTDKRFLVFTPANWDIPQTVSVRALNRDNKSVTITHTPVGADYTDLTDTPEVAVTITDGVFKTLQVTVGPVTEGGSVTVTVARPKPRSNITEFYWRTKGGYGSAPASSQDYTPRPNTAVDSKILTQRGHDYVEILFIDFLTDEEVAVLDPSEIKAEPEGVEGELLQGYDTVERHYYERSFTVQTTEDQIDEQDESFELDIYTFDLSRSGITHINIPAVVTITDDDNAVVSISDATAAEGEKVQFTVAVSGPVSQYTETTVDGVTTVTESAGDITLKANTGDDFTVAAVSRARAGVDYTAVTPPQTVTIPAGKTSATFEVEALRDMVREEPETFLVELSELAPSNAVFALRGDRAQGTITNTWHLGDFIITGLADATVYEDTDWQSDTPGIEGEPVDSVADIVWSIAGGADAARFTIDAGTGVLSLPGQDYANPADQDQDNRYEVTIRATDKENNFADGSLSVAIIARIPASLSASPTGVGEEDGATEVTVT
ncbi:MAG: hypothetical protein OXI54_02225, partial [Chloroflexota bacterium]|nr:hypothetical protein [Chloroflexota bacterium]